MRRSMLIAGAPLVLSVVLCGWAAIRSEPRLPFDATTVNGLLLASAALRG